MVLIFVYVNIPIFIKHNLIQVGLCLTISCWICFAFMDHVVVQYSDTLLKCAASIFKCGSNQYAVQKPKRQATAQQLL